MKTQPHTTLGKRQYSHHIVTCVIFLLILLTIPLLASCSCKEELSGQDEIILQLKHDLNYIHGDGEEEEEAMVRHAVLQALGRGTEATIERGDAGAQYDLGLCYAAGKGVEEDETQAAKWLCEAVWKGNTDAKELLQKLAPGKAARLYQIAAEAGNNYAIGRLAECYRDGRGVEKDEEKAQYWSQRHRGYDSELQELITRHIEAFDLDDDEL